MRDEVEARKSSLQGHLEIDCYAPDQGGNATKPTAPLEHSLELFEMVNQFLMSSKSGAVEVLGEVPFPVQLRLGQMTSGLRAAPREYT